MPKLGQSDLIIPMEANCSRLPGLAMFYSELVQGIPPIFKHYVANVPALHSVFVFVSIKSLPIGKVPAEERFLFRRVEPKELNAFRCVARYGYKDVRNDEEPFETMLVEKLKEFIRVNYWCDEDIQSIEDNGEDADAKIAEEEKRHEEVEREMELIDKAWHAGVIHLIGENEVVAKKGAGAAKRILIDYAYNFMKKNLRQSEKVFDIPHI